MKALPQARQLVRDHALTPELRQALGGHLSAKQLETMRSFYNQDAKEELSTEQVIPAMLAEGLYLVTDLVRERIDDESSAPLGVSKYRGLPHLPKQLTWPDGGYFVAQLDLAELSDDGDGFLPASGLLYLFFHTNNYAGTLIHFGGSKEALEVRPYPDRLTIPDAEHYLDDFMAASSLVTLEGRYCFGYDTEEIEKNASLLPADLRVALDALLGCRLGREDLAIRLFGPPRCWQGDEEEVEESGQLMVFQDDFGEGNIHFWLDEPLQPDTQVSCAVSYSGT